MLIIDKGDLARATEAVLICARRAKTTGGHAIIWHPDGEHVQRAICAMLSILVPIGGIDVVVPEGVHFVHDVDGSSPVIFPPRAP